MANTPTVTHSNPNTGGATAPAREQQHQEQAPAGQRLYYPMNSRPLISYKTGGRYFGAPRTRNRIHAGIDLIHPYLTPIRAIADGVVIQAPYAFYEGTNALEVRHPGIGVVRYGEISSARVVRLAAGQPVTAGQLIAYVGKLNGSGSSMLHFELYSGTATGGLTVRSNLPYQRRRDLQNPTPLMDRLINLTFGN